MTNIPDTNSHYDNVLSAIDLLSDSVSKYEGALMESIAELAKNWETDQIKERLAEVDRIKGFSQQIVVLNQRWQEAVTGTSEDDSSISETTDDDSTTREVSARTSWKIAGNTVRIETERVEGPSYSNVFPVSIFKDIARTAIKLADKNGFVKTSEVLTPLESKIVSQSDYKKTPRIPVYASFKVLVKENILNIDENNSHKYLLGLSKNKATSWVEAL